MRIALKTKHFGLGVLVGALCALGLVVAVSQFLRDDEVDVYGVQGVTTSGEQGMRVFAKSPADGCNAYKLSVVVAEQDEEAVVIKPSLAKLPTTGDCTLQLGGDPMSVETTVSLNAPLGRRIVYQDSRDRANFVPKLGTHRGTK